MDTPTCFACSLTARICLSKGPRPDQVLAKQALSDHMISTYIYATAHSTSSSVVSTSAFLYLPVQTHDLDCQLELRKQNKGQDKK